MTKPRILMVLTSHDQLGNTGNKTGYWLEEFASPYYTFIDAGAEVALASVAGGEPPVDPTSTQPDWQTDATRRLAADAAANTALSQTTPIADVDATAFDAIFFPGGHGPMWDFPGNVKLAKLIEAFNTATKPIGAVCHGVVALVDAQKPDGSPLVAGQTVTSFTNGEEEVVGLTEVVPFLLENCLRELGAAISNGEDFSVNVVTNENLVTGQNPQSSAAGAKGILSLLNGA